MKVAAHPLVVAVALGLLAPQALEAQASEDDPTRIGQDCDSDGWPTDPAPDPTDWDAPTPEEFHRVELAWLKLDRG